MALSLQVLVVRKWFDKWRAPLQLRVLTKTADKHYNGLLLKKVYCFVTSKHIVCVYVFEMLFVVLVEYKISSCKEILFHSSTVITYGLFCMLESSHAY